MVNSASSHGVLCPETAVFSAGPVIRTQWRWVKMEWVRTTSSGKQNELPSLDIVHRYVPRMSCGILRIVCWKKPPLLPNMHFRKLVEQGHLSTETESKELVESVLRKESAVFYCGCRYGLASGGRLLYMEKRQDGRIGMTSFSNHLNLWTGCTRNMDIDLA